MVTFDTADYAIIIIYFLIALFIGFRTKKSKNTALDFIIASRNISLPAFVATLVASFYGGILGIGEFTYKYGLSSWFLNAVPYYIFITIFAFFLSKKIRRTGLYSIPDKLDLHFGKTAGVIGGGLIFLLCTPAPYIFMMGVLVSLIFNISINLSMIISLVISIIYLFRGGFNSNVNVNIFEFVIMFIGFGIIIPFCIIKIFGINDLFNSLPESHKSISGGNNWQFILTWYLIGAWALVDPTFHQRCYAAKSDKIAKKGVLISLIFWFIFDFLTTTAGLYAFVTLKNIDNPAMSYPLLAQSILPVVAKGIFFIGMIATIMSTLHSNFFLASSSLGRDVIARLLCDVDNIKFLKISILITAVISVIIPIIIPSVVQMWYLIGSLTIPPLLISVLNTYSKKIIINRNYIIIIMLISFIINLFWIIFGLINKDSGVNHFPFGIEPFFPGLLVGIIIFLVGYFINKKEVRINVK